MLAYADPVARFAADGQMIFPGHRGTIYRAHNGLHLGRTRPRLEWMLPDATVLSERGLQKIRTGERSAGSTERLLIASGATPRRCGQTRRDWLTQALREAGARQVPHSGKHKFAWVIGPRRMRTRITIAAPSFPTR
ncbi:hypothetical protein ACIBH1_44715 [Nonomuraea sp. NPDC050663]|uniref:hypothetical protein n=1 Tax=Nonomuraea sp. NPDC050663 TaxID=3364370 RepID=UPI00378C20D8